MKTTCVLPVSFSLPLAVCLLATSLAYPADTAPSRLKVGVVQMAVARTVEANRDRIVAGIVQAAASRVRVAVFPEGVLRGQGGDDQAIVSAAVEAIRRAARKSRVYVLFGGFTYLPHLKKDANWMLVLSPDGRNLFRYEKLYNNHRAAMPGVFLIDGIPCNAMNPMSNTSLLTCLAVALLHWTAASPVLAAAGPFVQGRFQGRIAYSCDGNHNDPDDWAASPVTLAILAEGGLKERLALSVNRAAQGAAWESPGESRGWTSRTIREVAIRRGDEIRVDVQADGGKTGKLDYVQLNCRGDASSALISKKTHAVPTSPLDDPDALRGQVIIAGGRPGYLKYNGGGPVFLCGPDNPEEFLFLGTLNKDGTRSGGRQSAPRRSAVLHRHRQSSPPREVAWQPLSRPGSRDVVCIG